jgi:hypothetical protein
MKHRLATPVGLALGAGLPAAANAEWVTSPAGVQVSQSNFFFDRAKGVFYTQVGLVNQTGNALTGPLRVPTSPTSASIWTLAPSPRPSPR